MNKFELGQAIRVIDVYSKESDFASFTMFFNGSFRNTADFEIFLMCCTILLNHKIPFPSILHASLEDKEKLGYDSKKFFGVLKEDLARMLAKTNVGTTQSVLDKLCTSF